MQLESIQNGQTIFGSFRIFSKNGLKLQKSVALVAYNFPTFSSIFRPKAIT